jgi:hypothetical protein
MDDLNVDNLHATRAAAAVSGGKTDRLGDQNTIRSFVAEAIR